MKLYLLLAATLTVAAGTPANREYQEEDEVIVTFNRFEEHATGLIMPENPEEDPESERIIQSWALNRGAIPRNYDSTRANLVTKAKNQRQCGSCAAFASTSVIETCMMKAGGQEADLSEQQLIDCGFNGKSMNGCNGAHPHGYLEMCSQRMNELVHEFHYPYLESKPILNCQRIESMEAFHTGASITEFVRTYKSTEEKLRDMVYHHASALTAIYASDEAFQRYDGGIFDSCTAGKKFNHAVVVVGFGVTPQGERFWKGKNSWGEHWGEDGFFRMKYGRGTCGIGEVAVSVGCSPNNKRRSITPTTTTPKPTTTTQEPLPEGEGATCDISKLYRKGINTKGMWLNTRINGKLYKALVKCVDSVCAPLNKISGSCCQYICGHNSCTF